MADEEKTKDFAEQEPPVEEAAEQVTDETTAEVSESPVAPPCIAGAEEEKTAVDSPEERRGRLVVGGLFAATVLALVAVLVAGIFQLTARWLTECPRELPVNDPSPVLWSEMITDKEVSQPLGIQDKLSEITRFKTTPPPAQASGEPGKQDQ